MDRQNEIVSLLRALDKAVDALVKIDDETISQNKTYSSAKIAALIAEFGYTVSILDELPTEGDSHTVYFIPAPDTQEDNVREEWMWVDEHWEKIGDTRLVVTAGNNISVINGVISALGYTYNTVKDSIKSGYNTTAYGMQSHAEGHSTVAYGNNSHAEGYINLAYGAISHVEGSNNITQNREEHAEGRCNVSHKASDTVGDAGNTQHSIGIGTGTSASQRENAIEVMQNADIYIKGIGGYQGKDTKVQNPSIKTVQEVIASKQDNISDLATIRSGAALGATALQSFKESDPTVPAWAKESSKPTYTAQEVGALPSNTFIPTKTSDLTNNSGYLTQHQDITGKEDKSNKVTSLSNSSTDTQYPSAKCVYDLLPDEDEVNALINDVDTNANYIQFEIEEVQS